MTENTEDTEEKIEELIEKSNEDYTSQHTAMVVTAIAVLLFLAIPVVYYFAGFNPAIITSVMCALVVFALKHQPKVND